MKIAEVYYYVDFNQDWRAVLRSRLETPLFHASDRLFIEPESSALKDFEVDSFPLRGHHKLHNHCCYYFR